MKRKFKRKEITRDEQQHYEHNQIGEHHKKVKFTY
jgi:hypothetical protein